MVYKEVSLLPAMLHNMLFSQPCFKQTLHNLRGNIL
jgi:hypothetical protein